MQSYRKAYAVCTSCCSLPSHIMPTCTYGQRLYREPFCSRQTAAVSWSVVSVIPEWISESWSCMCGRTACFLDSTPGLTVFKIARASPCRDGAPDSNINTIIVTLTLTLTVAVFDLRCGPKGRRSPHAHHRFPTESLLLYVMCSVIVEAKRCHCGHAIAFPPLLLFVRGDVIGPSSGRVYLVDTCRSFGHQ